MARVVGALAKVSLAIAGIIGIIALVIWSANQSARPGPVSQAAPFWCGHAGQPLCQPADLADPIPNPFADDKTPFEQWEKRHRNDPPAPGWLYHDISGYEMRGYPTKEAALAACTSEVAEVRTYNPNIPQPFDCGIGQIAPAQVSYQARAAAPVEHCPGSAGTDPDTKQCYPDLFPDPPAPAPADAPRHPSRSVSGGMSILSTSTGDRSRRE
jgi:hypothetical protein